MAYPFELSAETTVVRAGQVFDLQHDPTERNNLAPTQPALVAELWKVLQKYNDSAYVPALVRRFPAESKCPTTTAHEYGGVTYEVTTPC